MKHVDEGLLHAYLDDAFRPSEAMHTRISAHLALCGECRARLEEARQLRDLAGVIVEDLGPRGKIVLPAELIPAVAQDHSPPKTPRQISALHPGWIPLAWAASVLLALGGGWMVGDRWQVAERFAGPIGGHETEAGTTSTEAIPMPESEPVIAHGPDPDEPARAPLQPEAVLAAPATPAVLESAPPEPVLLPEVMPRLATRPETPLPELPARPAAPRLSLPEGEVAVVSLPRAAEIAPPPRAAEARRGREGVAAERTAAGPLPESPATSPRGGPARGGPRPQRAGPGGVRRIPPFAAPRTSRPQPEVQWRPVFLIDAEERLGEPLAFVEGLPISGVWIAQEESGWKARLTQPLEGGGMLELIQWRAGTGRIDEAAQVPDPQESQPADPAGPRILQSIEAGTGRATVLLRLRPGGPMLSLSAPLSPEALLELASRVRVGQ